MDAPHWKWADIPVEDIDDKLEALGISKEFYHKPIPVPTPEEFEAHLDDLRGMWPWRSRWFKFKRWIRRLFKRRP